MLNNTLHRSLSCGDSSESKKYSDKAAGKERVKLSLDILE